MTGTGATGYLLDTNVCIAYMQACSLAHAGRTALQSRVLEKLEGLPRAVPVYISQVTLGELVFGAEKSQNRDKNLHRIRLLTEGIPALPVDETAWRHFGKLKAGLQKIGRPVADLDTVFAATAQHYGLTLSTLDDGLQNLIHLDPQPVTVER